MRLKETNSGMSEIAHAELKIASIKTSVSPGCKPEHVDLSLP